MSELECSIHTCTLSRVRHLVSYQSASKPYTSAQPIKLRFTKVIFKVNTNFVKFKRHFVGERVEDDICFLRNKRSRAIWEEKINRRYIVPVLEVITIYTFIHAFESMSLLVDS